MTMWNSWLPIYLLVGYALTSKCRAGPTRMSGDLIPGPSPQNNVCDEKPLEIREEEANVIFSGTVKNVHRDWTNPSTQQAEVEVKRVFKGDGLVNSLQPARMLRTGARAGMPWEYRRMVVVDGLGDPRMCQSNARTYDTKIFLVNKASNGHLKLNSSLVALTLDNLRYTEAAVKNKVYLPEPTPAPDPCERKYCPFWALCQVEPNTNRASCRCPDPCDPNVFSPVCGSDQVDYSSECLLKLTSCQQRRRIKVASRRPCNVEDPCASKRCSFGAKCVTSVDGTTARCQCPEKCPRYGDSVGSKPVCGSDGHDYGNVCEMERAACSSMREINVTYEGKCDPCRNHQCPDFSVCQLDVNRQPICTCSTTCTMPFRPVCASDGNTYSNICIMQVEACKRRITLRPLFNGDCSSDENPCRTIQCGPGQGCDVDTRGRATCSCPPPCEPVLRHVCGTDGRTYSNECELERSSCDKRVRLGVKYGGMCENGPCLNHHCQFGARCIAEKGRPTCQCEPCTGHYKPVCGSDHLTYDNECKLRAESCERQVSITVMKQGQCDDPCTNYRCDHYGYCEKNSRGRPHCVCPRSCVQVVNEVCGTDGITYQNECELQVASCQKQQYVAVASQGPCDPCRDMDCRQGASCVAGECICLSRCDESSEVVCATNAKTYSSICDMDRQACLSNTELEMLHRGECDDGEDSAEISGSGGGITCDETTCRFGGRCEDNAQGVMHCACSFTCEATWATVCGSDGKTYGNECQMRQEACRQQTSITSQPMDTCDTDLVEVLCNGNPPLRHPMTGREYDCRDGSDICTAGAYCHILEGVARCCSREDQTVRSCSESRYGCCQDGKTTAPAPNFAGCPSQCGCHVLGSLKSTCDPNTGQCYCRAGVSGLRCDRCQFAFWGLHKIAEGSSGCMPCGCSMLGSKRDDCNQTSGSCECERGYMGLKCDICSDNTTAGHAGCDDIMLRDSGFRPTSCAQFECRHGAVCNMFSGAPRCECQQQCDSNPSSSGEVCATNGLTYASRCELQFYSCQLQQDIGEAYRGHCHVDKAVTPRTSTRPRKTTRHVDVTKHSRFTPTYGDLGNFCSQDEECLTNNSRCFNSICTCKENMEVTNDGEHCDVQGDLFTIPAFAGNSFIELGRLHHGNREVSIELIFTPSSEDGLLLYSSQFENGTGDFMSLALVDGLLEYRYDLGSGPALLSSSAKLALHKQHTLVARRHDKDGMLVVDGEEEALGTSPGNLESLNLESPVFLGGVPSYSESIRRDVGTDSGYTGCVADIKISSNQVEKHYDLAYPSSLDVTRAVHVGDCFHSDCSITNCLNGGTCIPRGGTFDCKCPPGLSGSMCEKQHKACTISVCSEGSSCFDKEDGNFMCVCQPGHYGILCDQVITIPQFSRDSYIELQTSHNLGRTFSFEIWFLATDPDGVLLYSQQEDVANGDFLSLSLVNGYLVFRYDLGSGPADIRSQFPVPLNTWNQVEISRTQQQGSIVVNRAQSVTGQALGSLTQLNLPQWVYLGGYPGDHQRRTSVTRGFSGAIQRFYEDGMLVEDLAASFISVEGISQYEGPPCSSALCQNGGQCLPHLNDYQCRCPPRTTGRHCENLVEPSDTGKAGSQAIAFSGTTHHKYMNRVDHKLRAESTNSIKLQFRTAAQDGLILLLHKSSTVMADYLAIAINRGHVQASFNLGKESSSHLLLMTSARTVSDNQWHTLHFLRDKRKGSLQVDDESPITVLSLQGATQLDTNGDLWIGGSRNPPAELPDAYMAGFVGCMNSVVINGTGLDLSTDRINLDAIQLCDD